MSAIEIKDDVAPLGLDFEMPETAWVWQLPVNKEFLSREMDIEDVYFIVASASAIDITLAVLRPIAGGEYGGITLEGDDIAKGWPSCVTHGALMEYLASDDSSGVVFVDSDFKEIGRVYSR